jgi:hypothetical protein
MIRFAHVNQFQLTTICLRVCACEQRAATVPCLAAYVNSAQAFDPRSQVQRAVREKHPSVQLLNFLRAL